jgi:hypothetical protein
LIVAPGSADRGCGRHRPRETDLRALPILFALLCGVAFPTVAEASDAIEGDGYKLRLPAGYANTYDSCTAGST